MRKYPKIVLVSGEDLFGLMIRLKKIVEKKNIKNVSFYKWFKELKLIK